MTALSFNAAATLLASGSNDTHVVIWRATQDIPSASEIVHNYGGANDDLATPAPEARDELDQSGRPIRPTTAWKTSTGSA